MAATPLTDLLVRLATDLQLLQTFNASVANATQLMTEAGLSDAQQQAVLSKNVSAIHYQLQQEGTHGDFVVPGGPVLDERGRFTVGPQGVMTFEPPVLPSPAPVLSGGRTGGRTTVPPPPVLPGQPPPVLPGKPGKPGKPGGPRRRAVKTTSKKRAAKAVKRSTKAKKAKAKRRKK